MKVLEITPRSEPKELTACVLEWSRFDLDRAIPLPGASESLVEIRSLHTSAWPDQLLAEAWRILRPGGIVRVEALDMEAVLKAYLEESFAGQVYEPTSGVMRPAEWFELLWPAPFDRVRMRLGRLPERAPAMAFSWGTGRRNDLAILLEAHRFHLARCLPCRSGMILAEARR